MRFARSHVLLLLLASCSSTHVGDLDASVDTDAGGLADSGVLAADGGPPALDGGRDSGPPDVMIDAGVVDAGGGVVGRVRCGDSECTVPGQGCRATCMSAGEIAPVCVDAPEGWEIGECPDEETFPIVVARCDGPEDCGPDATCLVLLGSLGNYPQCGCERQPDGGCSSTSTYLLCHTLADCPAGYSACEIDSDLLRGHYRTCVD